MRVFKLSIILIFFGSFTALTQEQTFTEAEIAIDKYTDGTLVLPSNIDKPPLIIFIQGSGPTNRDGNSPEGMNNKSDFAKKIAHELAENEIASYRFDKRIFKAQELSLKEISFDDFVIDVENILNHFNKNDEFSKIIIAGHSQGSLVGMLAAQNNTNAFISLAGAGESIDHIFSKQLSAQLPQLKDALDNSLQEIKESGKSTDYPRIFESVFHPKNQAFLNSWMNYDPAEEIAKLEIPVLIINGTRDIQVKEGQAELLHKATPNSKLILLKDMNHVFRKIKEEEKDQNLASYNNPEMPLHPELIPVLTDFIKNLENK